MQNYCNDYRFLYCSFQLNLDCQCRSDLAIGIVIIHALLVHSSTIQLVHSGTFYLTMLLIYCHLFISSEAHTYATGSGAPYTKNVVIGSTLINNSVKSHFLFSFVPYFLKNSMTEVIRNFFCTFKVWRFSWTLIVNREAVKEFKSRYWWFVFDIKGRIIISILWRSKYLIRDELSGIHPIFRFYILTPWSPW